jgi:hypothetical protein
MNTVLTYSLIACMFAMQILSVMLKRYVNMDKVKTQLDLQRVSSGLAMSKE